MSAMPKISRRTALWSGAAASGAVVLGVLVTRPRWLFTGPGLFGAGIEAKQAAIVGVAFLAQNRVGNSNLREEIAARLAKAPLSSLAAADIAQGDLVEAKGWVLPEIVALICAAATTS